VLHKEEKTIEIDIADVDPEQLDTKGNDSSEKQPEITPNDTSKECINQVESEQRSKFGMKYRIRQILNTIRTIPRKIIRIVMKIKKVTETILHFPKKVRTMKIKIKDMVLDEEAKSAFHMVIKSVKNLLKHVAPRSVKGEIVFGLDDPCTTGKVLGVASIVYTYLNLKHFHIYPDFNQTIFEGKIDAKGRVYFFTILHIVIRLLRDKHFQTLRKRIKQFKEE